MANEELEDKEKEQQVEQVNAEEAQLSDLVAISNAPTTETAPPVGGGTVAPTTAPPVQQTAPPVANTSAPIGGGTATAAVPTATGASGVAAGNSTLAPPVSAGATGNNAGNNDSPTAGSGMGGNAPSGSGAPQDGGRTQEQGTSNNDTFTLNLREITRNNIFKSDKKTQVGGMSFMDKAINFMRNQVAYDENAQTVTVSNIALGSVENRLFSFTDTKIDSLVFSTANGLPKLQSVTISSGAISLLSARGFYYGEGMTATLNGGQSEYNVTVRNANINLMGDVIKVDGGYFRIGTDGKFIEAGAPQIKSLIYDVKNFKVTNTSVSLESLDLGVKLFGKGIGVNFANVDVTSGSINGTGTLTPMSDLTFMNGKGTFTNPQAQVTIANNQVSGWVKTGITYENGLFTADEIKAELSNQGAAVTMDKAVANIMGEPVGLANTYIRMGAQGEFLEAGAGTIETRKFKADGLVVTPEGLKVKEVQAVLPPLLGKPLDVKFQELSAINGVWNATGSVTPDGELSYMDGKLKLPNFNAQVAVTNNAFSGTITSNVVYEDPERMAKANGLGTITIGADASSFQLTNGTAEVEMSGMKFAGEGVEMGISGAQQMLKIQKGNINIPYFNDKFNVSIKNGLLDSQNGFKFDEMKLATGGFVEILPNFKVSGNVIVKRNGTSNEYGVSVVGGIVDYKGGPGGLEIGAKVNFNYSPTAGLSGTISKTDIKTNFADFNAANSIAITPEGFTMPAVTAKVKGLSPQPLTATATGVAYNKESGFKLDQLKVALPQIGETQINAEVNQLAIGSTMSVGEVKVAFSTGNQISLAGGKVNLANIAGGANIGADGKWGFNIGSDLSVNIPKFEGSGRVNVGYDQTGPILDVQNGSIKTSFNGIDVKATGLGYDIKTKKLMVRKAEVTVPEFNGVQVTATADKVSIGPNGFEGTLKLAANGEIQLMDGVKVTKLEGTYAQAKGASTISMTSSASVQTSSFTGNIKNVKASFSETAKTFSAEGLTLNTPYFDVTVAKANYNHTEGSFAMESAQVKTKGFEKFGNPAATATGVSYNKEGLKIASFNSALGWEGNKGALTLNATNINLPASGDPTGSAQLTLNNNFALAGGAIKVGQPRAIANMTKEGWDLSVEGVVELAGANGTASGLVSVGYNSKEGLKANVSNASFNAQFPSLGLTVAAENINYDYNKKAVTVEKGTVTASKIGTGLTGEISGLTMSGKDINFKDLKVAAGGMNFEVVSGVNMSLNQVSLSKEKNSLVASLQGGINIDRQSPVYVKANTTGTLNYDITNNKISGSVNKFDLETSIFKTKVQNINFTREGFTIASATLGLSSQIDAKSMQKYIPGFQPWMLDFVKGVEFVGEQISYDKKNGLQIGKFYPNIPPIAFEMFDGALKGELDLKNQKGFLEGNKTFDLPGINTPTFTVPIVPGVNGEISAGVKASLSMGARIDLAKKGDYWDLTGGISLGANIDASIYGGVSLSVVIASVSAGIRVTASLSAKGTASLGGGIRYNPDTKSVELATPLRFNYSMLAKLAAKLQLAINGYAAGINVYSNDIDLAEWEIGTLELSGESQSPDFGGLWGNLKNKAKVTAFGSTVYEK